jgi:hypothetical protein
MILVVFVMGVCEDVLMILVVFVIGAVKMFLTHSE